SGESIGVAQASIELVLDVPGRPHPIEIEATGRNRALGQLFEENLAIHERCVCARATRLTGPRVAHEPTDIAVPLFVLDFLQLSDDVIGPLLETRITGGGIHQTHR